VAGVLIRADDHLIVDDGLRLSSSAGRKVSTRCALGLARSACLISGGVVGVAKLMFDRAERAER
jgi:hypothetical protein